MKILKLSVRLWQVCGIYLPVSSTAMEYFSSILSVFVILCGLQAFFWLSIAYVMAERHKIDTANLFYPLTQICAISAVFGPYVSTVFARRKFGEMVELLQQVVNESNIWKWNWIQDSLFLRWIIFRNKTPAKIFLWKSWKPNEFAVEVVTRFVSRIIQRSKIDYADWKYWTWFDSWCSFRLGELLRLGEAAVSATNSAN